MARDDDLRGRLGDRFEPEVRSVYPHMLAEDQVVWSRWLAGNASRVTACWYDVHVGEAMPVPVGLGPNMEAVAMAVSRKRIDVVALVGGTWWVIEVKPFASHTALGQIITYRRLFLKEFSPVGPVVGVVVCGSVDVDSGPDFAAAGVRIEMARAKSPL